MAYEKHEWQTGEVITAEKLNHAEEGIKTLSDNGFEIVSGGSEVLLEEKTFSFEDSQNIGYSEQPILPNEFSSYVLTHYFTNPSSLPESLEIIFDGVRYTANLVQYNSTVYYYGAEFAKLGIPFDFSEYPFNFEVQYTKTEPKDGPAVYELGAVVLSVQTQGNHTIAIQRESEDKAIPSDNFKKAVGASYFDVVRTNVVYFEESEIETEINQDGGTDPYCQLNGFQGYDDFGDEYPETLKITFDGTVYNVHPDSDGEYGAPYSPDGMDWSVYPFNLYISIHDQTAYFSTETVGQHTVKIERDTEEEVLSNSFKKAVEASIETQDSQQESSGLFICNATTVPTASANGVCDKSASEILTAFTAGKLPLLIIPVNSGAMSTIHVDSINPANDQSGKPEVIFKSVTYGSGYIRSAYYTVAEDKSITYYTEQAKVS